MDDMADTQIEKDVAGVAAAAAEAAARVLRAAIAARGRATWLLAGGSAPMAAYRILAAEYQARVDWQRVYVAIGDERCVPADSPDANWLQVSDALLNVVDVPDSNRLRPAIASSPEIMAEQYATLLATLPQTANAVPHFDLAWLGLGEDGHTLSLFPGRDSQAQNQSLVVAVHDSPKPPPDRVSLTLRAVQGIENGFILATGPTKSTSVSRALQGDTVLPIVQVVNTIEQAGGHVTWLLDPEVSVQASST